MAILTILRYIVREMVKNSHYQRFLGTYSGVFEVQWPLQALENIKYDQKLIQNDHNNIRDQYSNNLRCVAEPISRLSQKLRFGWE